MYVCSSPDANASGNDSERPIHLVTTLGNEDDEYDFENVSYSYTLVTHDNSIFWKALHTTIVH